MYTSGLFNDFESSTDYVALKDGMNKERGKKNSWVSAITSVFLKSMREITKIIMQY
jgi:hypothetical protein